VLCHLQVEYEGKRRSSSSGSQSNPFLVIGSDYLAEMMDGTFDFNVTCFEVLALKRGY